MTKNYLIVFICSITCLLQPLRALSQINCSSCNGNGNANYWCVSTAEQLYQALVTGIIGNPVHPPIGPGTSTTPNIIEICGTINLGELDAYISTFPWEVPAYVHLVGDCNFVSGTRIIMPYRFKSGIRCLDQQRVINGEIVEQSLPANEDDALNHIISAGNSEVAFVFAMQEGCEFRNICLQGPKPD